MSNPLPTGSVIGILGGGQLGRMLSIAASRLGYRCHVFEPAMEAPAGQVAEQLVTAPYEDVEALVRFAESVDIVTYEFENVPTEVLDAIEAHCPIRPGRNALAISQDRLLEKSFLEEQGLSVAPFADVSSLTDLERALDRTGVPAILKTRRFGYDGKGQVHITDAGFPEEAFAAIKGAEAILEGFVDFSHEVSVIAARSLDGAVACFDPGENVHRDGILRTTTVPARLSAAQRSDAVLMAAKILNALDYVGVLGVELFVTPHGLVVNEFAPRVHNSGHWTQNGCAIDQFEQHIRAIVGWPLGDGSRHSDVVMQNLIGNDLDDLPDIARDSSASLHLYGKPAVRRGRKMGHVNRVTSGR